MPGQVRGGCARARHLLHPRVAVYQLPGILHNTRGENHVAESTYKVSLIGTQLRWQALGHCLSVCQLFEDVFVISKLCVCILK